MYAGHGSSFPFSTYIKKTWRENNGLIHECDWVQLLESSKLTKLEPKHCSQNVEAKKTPGISWTCHEHEWSWMAMNGHEWSWIMMSCSLRNPNVLVLNAAALRSVLQHTCAGSWGTRQRMMQNVGQMSCKTKVTFFKMLTMCFPCSLVSMIWWFHVLIIYNFLFLSTWSDLLWVLKLRTVAAATALHAKCQSPCSEAIVPQIESRKDRILNGGILGCLGLIKFINSPIILKLKDYLTSMQVAPRVHQEPGFQFPFKKERISQRQGLKHVRSMNKGSACLFSHVQQKISIKMFKEHLWTFYVLMFLYRTSLKVFKCSVIKSDGQPWPRKAPHRQPKAKQSFTARKNWNIETLKHIF